MDFDKEVAEQVILPKLKKVYADSLQQDEPIKNKADLRKRFMDTFDTSMSAIKFDSWLEKLGIKFKRVVVIEGLEADISESITTMPSPGLSYGTPVDDEDDDEGFDNEVPSDMGPAKLNNDMFNMMNRQQ